MSQFVRFGSRCIVNLDHVCGVSYTRSEGVPCVTVTLSNGSGHHEGHLAHGATGRYEFHGHDAESVWKYFNGAVKEECFHESPQPTQVIPLDLVAMSNADEG